jgi:3-hydroxyisobutyrate dehydrogenase-like beta-hydroxyacid dehydrogenase
MTERPAKLAVLGVGAMGTGMADSAIRAGIPFSPEFPLGLALKDVDLALAEGDGDRFSVLAALSKEWTGIADQGLGTEDITVVTKVLAR